MSAPSLAYRAETSEIPQTSWSERYLEKPEKSVASPPRWAYRGGCSASELPTVRRTIVDDRLRLSQLFNHKYGLTLLTDEQHDALFVGYMADDNGIYIVREIMQEMSPWDAYVYNVTSRCL